MRKLTFAILSLLLTLALEIEAQIGKQPPAEPRDQKANAAQRETRSGTRIRGRVVTDGGRPVADASIMILPVNVAANMQSTVTSLLRPTLSDTDGNFELTSLRPGAYTISASSPGYVSLEQGSKGFYRPGDTATLTLVKGGVITGKVTNSSGDPVVGAQVRAIKTREPDDKPSRPHQGIGSQISESLGMLLGPYKTDDRGIYRIYGLDPGYYQVSAGGRGGQGFSFAGASAYDNDAPTYYPSSTMETAADVTVTAGGEATAIDIRYREHRGHSIGGSVSVSAGPAPQVISVILTRSNGVAESTAVVMGGRDHFGFDSLLDGDYLVTAVGNAGNPALGGAEGMSASVSQPKRVTVRGADVSGITLVIEPLASIAGRVAIESLQDPKQKAGCKDIRPTPIEGTVLSTQDERKETTPDPMIGPLGGFMESTPNEKGEFVIGLVRPGVQRLNIEVPAEHLYVKSMLLPSADPNGKPIDTAKTGLKLKSGDKIKGLLVTLAEGAAALSGKVVVDPDNKPPATKMRVHLVPAEPESTDEVLRYSESEVAADGSFSFAHLAPGKYWLVGRETPDEEKTEADHKPLAWDPAGRTALRFEGDATKKVVELTQCNMVTDYKLKYVPLIKPSKPPVKKASI